MTDIETLNKLAEILGNSGSLVTSEYATWFIYQAIIFTAWGLIMIVLGLKWKAKEEWDFPPIIIKCAIVFIGFLFVAENLPDLLVPKAAAIHQLICDVRGSK